VRPFESVSASVATLGRAIEVEDTAALQLRWRKGALGTMAVRMLTYPMSQEGSIILLGETGTVRIGGLAVNQIEHWAFADSSPEDALVDRPATRPRVCMALAISPTTPTCSMPCSAPRLCATAVRTCVAWSCRSGLTAQPAMAERCTCRSSAESALNLSSYGSG
jgi:hypothetical protein